MNAKEVYDRQFPRVYRLALLYLKAPSDAEDIAQNVFLKYLKKPKSFKDISHEKAWFITVTRNCCKDYLKSFWRQNVDLGDFPEREAESAGESVLDVMLKLPAKYREVLYMYYYEGYKAGEIAKMLKRNESTVCTQLSAGREKLRELLDREGYSYE